MTRGSRRLCGATCAALLLAASSGAARAAQQPEAAQAPAAEATTSAVDLPAFVATLESGLAEVERSAAAGDLAAARTRALRLYLDAYEPLEAYYGTGGPHAEPELARRVDQGERSFHALMQSSDAATAARLASELRSGVRALEAEARRAGVPLSPGALDLGVSAASGAAGAAATRARTPEIRAILESLDRAAAAYARGEARDALRLVEHAYLEGFEPIEPRLPAEHVERTERLIHLGLRPQIAQRASVAEVQATFTAVRGELLAADEALAAGASFWFGAFNAFAIILREGLEAVLLIGAILAYLGALGAGAERKRQIYAGVVAGVVASVGLWIVAVTLVPIGGGNRELIEGITALIAVAVLVYVSNWLFHKTYIHDWKDFLRERVERAVGTGSALAMAGLAFAAVFREGFETVLFYQALMMDAGARSVLAGFLPGAILILALGVGIVRMGMRLPLRKVFAATNAILIYLALVFVGKGVYNLQEAGLFAPTPVAWAPDHPALVQVFGFYPILETIALQGAFLLLIAATYVFYRYAGARRAALGASGQPQIAGR